MDIKERINEANQKACEILLKGKPVWIDVEKAIKAIPKMRKNMILHSGPPIEWERMCKPQKNSVICAVLYEKLADTSSDAIKLIKNGEIDLAPCHSVNAVGPMTGILSPSMFVNVIKNEAYGNKAYCSLQTGTLSNKALTWGSIEYQEVLNDHALIENTLGPVLKELIKEIGGLDLTRVIAQAITMGDECHSRCSAGTSLFVRKIAPHIVKIGDRPEKVSHCFKVLADADRFFLSPIMAAAKASLDAINGIDYCTIVTAMSRNGIDFGIHVSDLKDKWFTSPAGIIPGLYYPGYGPDDATKDIGDSSIVETYGLGGFIAASAPALIKSKWGGTVQDAFKLTREMKEITVGKNSNYLIPNLDFEPASLGIDIRKVVGLRIAPIIDTAAIHKEKGGIIGFGQARAPIECFEKALKSFAQKYSL